LKTVITELKDSVLHLTLNRPERGNSFDRSLLIELSDAFRSVNKSKTVRAVVLGGHGRHFCSGADLAWMARAGAMKPEDNLTEAYLLVELYEAILTCEAPVVVRAHGKVRGGGVGLIAAADIAICEEATTFGLPEAQLGLVPGVLTPVLIRKIGHSRFIHHSVSCDIFGAQEALAQGLVHFVGPEVGIDQHLKNLLSNILRSDRDAIRAIKTSGQFFVPIEKQELIEMAHQTAERRATPFVQERLAHFLKKS
jgi:methylglutaconyl-CoA hydratase